MDFPDFTAMAAKIGPNSNKPPIEKRVLDTTNLIKILCFWAAGAAII